MSIHIDESYKNTINMLERQCLQLQLLSHQQVNSKSSFPGGIVIAYRHNLWSYFTILAAKLEKETEETRIEDKFNDSVIMIKRVNISNSSKSETKRSRLLLTHLDEIFRDILSLRAHYDMI